MRVSASLRGLQSSSILPAEKARKVHRKITLPEDRMQKLEEIAPR